SWCSRMMTAMTSPLPAGAGHGSSVMFSPRTSRATSDAADPCDGSKWRPPPRTSPVCSPNMDSTTSRRERHRLAMLPPSSSLCRLAADELKCSQPGDPVGVVNGQLRLEGTFDTHPSSVTGVRSTADLVEKEVRVPDLLCRGSPYPCRPRISEGTFDTQPSSVTGVRSTADLVEKEVRVPDLLCRGSPYPCRPRTSRFACPTRRLRARAHACRCRTRGRGDLRPPPGAARRASRR